MKVVLEAFGGKLRSDVMDWPESTGPDIRMRMDMDRNFSAHYCNDPRRFDPGAMPQKVARFVATDRHAPLPDRGTARIYRLVDF